MSQVETLKAGSNQLGQALRQLLEALEKNNLQEFGPKLRDVQPKLDYLRQSVGSNLPGIQSTEREQLRRIAQLYEHLQLKSRLIDRYRSSGATFLDIEEDAVQETSGGGEQETTNDGEINDSGV